MLFTVSASTGYLSASFIRDRPNAISVPVSEGIFSPRDSRACVDPALRKHIIMHTVELDTVLSLLIDSILYGILQSV